MSTQTWKQQDEATNSPASTSSPSKCTEPFKYTWKSLLFSECPLDQLLKIEINILLIAILIILIFYLGLKRRSSRSSCLNFVVFLSYVGFTSLISYTMGMMYSSTSKLYHTLYGLWAGVLLNAYFSVDTIVAYSLMDHENRCRNYLELLLLSFLFGFLMGSHTRQLPIFISTIVLWFLLILTSAERLQVFEFACRSGLDKYAKSTHDFMENHSNSQQVSEIADPKTMMGYKYLLEDPYDEDFVTLERLWQFDGGILKSTNEIHYAKLRDICVSFALFKLLLRRFAGYTMHEANQGKSWRFVRRGLLHHQSYTRPFQVIEDELRYVYEFFYTKYCVLAILGLLRKMIKTGLYIGCGIYISIELARRPLEEDKSSTIKYHKKHVVDVGITRIALAIIALLEVTQLSMLVLSNWTIVRWLVMYVKAPQSLNKFKKIVLLKLFPLAHNWNFVYKPWARKLGQYSFLERYACIPLLFRINIIVFVYIPLSRMITVPRIGQVEDSDINLSDEVKMAVIESLKTYNDDFGPPRLTNGITSLSRNGVFEILSWACCSNTQVEVVMVWHIATSIIHQRQSPSDGASANVLGDFHVATSLSKYCAYLAVFAPQLLSGHPHTAECIFDDLVKKAKELFGNKDINMDSKIQKLLEIQEDNDGCSLKRGGLVAQILLNQVQSQDRIWKILAEFWAEMILFLAPSNNATAHAECFAKGGEFITHLWALLTHAGILTTTNQST